MSLCPLLDIISCKVSSLVWRNDAQLPRLGSYLLSGSFMAQSIYILLQLKKARVNVYSFQDSFVAPQSHQHQSHLPASWSFPPENLPYGHLQCLSFFFFLTDSSYWGLCLRRCKTNMSILSPSLHCCIASDTQCPLISWAQVATLNQHMKYLLVDSNHILNLEGGSICSTLMHLSNP